MRNTGSPSGDRTADQIFIKDGKVTLRGPVRSEEEKVNLEAKAANVAGQENVSNQLEVAASK